MQQYGKRMNIIPLNTYSAYRYAAHAALTGIRYTLDDSLSPHIASEIKPL